MIDIDLYYATYNSLVLTIYRSGMQSFVSSTTICCIHYLWRIVRTKDQQFGFSIYIAQLL